jgi:hypothetical protein
MDRNIVWQMGKLYPTGLIPFLLFLIYICQTLKDYKHGNIEERR